MRGIDFSNIIEIYYVVVWRLIVVEVAVFRSGVVNKLESGLHDTVGFFAPNIRI